MYQAKILADSINAAGDRLTTMEVTYPRLIHSEFMTHRMFSRNSASSRAIPIATMIQRAMENPFVPTYWGANQKGMQAHQEVGEDAQRKARYEWLLARDSAVQRVKSLLALGVHKQLANRLLEPFQWHTVIVSATEWDNFFEQRCHPDAQPEIRTIAEMMRNVLNASTPTLLHAHEWHTPLLPDEDDLLKVYDHASLLKISAARCARVSYLTHDRQEVEKDLERFEKLVNHRPIHASPLEHVATPCLGGGGNLKGWMQLRQFVERGIDIS